MRLGLIPNSIRNLEFCAYFGSYAGKITKFGGWASAIFLACSALPIQASIELVSYDEVASWKDGVAVFEIAGANVRIRDDARADAKIIASLGGKRGAVTVIAEKNLSEDWSGRKWRSIKFISTASDGCFLSEPSELGSNTGNAYIADDFLKPSLTDENGCLDAALAKKFGIMDFSQWIAVDSPYLARFVLGRDAAISLDGLHPETLPSGSRLAVFGSSFLSVSGVKSGTLFLELGGGYYQRLGDADMEKILALPIASGKDKLTMWSKSK